MIAIRPPEYFPGLATLALVARADRAVLADTAQYSRRTFMNRARLRTPPRPRGAWMWISVPLRRPWYGRPVREVEIDASVDWAGPHLRAFEHNYRAAPFYAFFEDELRSLLRQPYTYLADLTCATTSTLARWYRLSTPLVRASDLPGAPSALGDILEVEGGGELLTPESAAARDAAQLGRSVHAFRYEPPHYRQNFDGFEPGMTALDLLFNYGPEAPVLLRQDARKGQGLNDEGRRTNDEAYPERSRRE